MVNTDKEKDLDRMYSYLKECRKDYVKLHNDSEDSFDKVLLAVAVPAVGWFFLCLDKMPPYNFFMIILALIIVLSWFAVIILNIYSYIWAKQNARKKIIEIDSEYEKYSDIVKSGGVDGIWKDEVFEEQKIVDDLNKWAARSFFVGLIVLFIYFICLIWTFVPFNPLCFLFATF